MRFRRLRGLLNMRLPRRRAVGLLVAALFVLAVLASTQNRADRSTSLSLDEFAALVEAGDVVKADMIYDSESVTLELADGSEATVDLPLRGSEAWSNRLLESGAEVTVSKAPPEGLLSRLFFLLFPFVAIGAIMLVVLRAAQGGLSVARSKRITQPALPPATRFTDVAGSVEVCEELADVVMFLRHPERFSATRARMPRGVLLVGPPGTGKTLLARAVAGEAGVPFFALAGSDFTETFVGVGAARIRDLFKTARAAGKAIIFIDEIDSVGRSRSAGPANGASDEADRTLNMLLSEMDGFAGREGIVVIGATNRADILDPALRRPGRFDRSVTVPVPDLAGRREILSLYARRYPHDGDIDIDSLAARTPGLAGADLDVLWNEAAIAAAKDGRSSVSFDDLEAALGSLLMGPERRSRVLTAEQREVVAWHEAGHTTLALLDDALPRPLSVSIVPRGDAGGMTWYGARDERFISASAASAWLRALLAGRGGEKVLLGDDFTQGAVDDFSKASQIAYQMTASWGMTSLGVGDFTAATPWARPTEDEVARQMRALLAEAEVETDRLLSQHGLLLARIARMLLDRETLNAADLETLAVAHAGCAGCADERASGT